MGNFCKYCTFWKEAFTRVVDEKFGICNSLNVNDEIVKEENSSSADEDGVIFTREWFGCIHFRDTPTVLIDLGDITKDL